MNLYERPVTEKLQAEAARIPLPPRERWVPPPRSRVALLPILATTAALVLVVLVAAPVIEELRSRSPEVASSPVPTSCATAAAQTVPAACTLILGRVTEVLGPQLIRVTPDSTKQVAGFENPSLFEAQAGTLIEPAAPSIAATGILPGAEVRVAFDRGTAKTSAGAYVLTRLVVVRAGAAPDCSGGVAWIQPATFPQSNVVGGATPEAALRSAYPTAGPISMFPFGSLPNAPVWIVAGGSTYVATFLPGGTWFVSPASFVRCRSREEIQSDPHAPSPTTSPGDQPSSSPRTVG